MAVAAGWLGRAARLIDESGLDCVESGYLLVPEGMGQLDAGEPVAALATFERAAAIAARFEDPDLGTLTRLFRGRALIDMAEIAARRGAARRGDGRRHRRRGVADHRRDRVLRLDRGLRAHLRSTSGAGMDGGAPGMVRRAARCRSVPWPVPRLSRRAEAVPRGVDRGNGRGAQGRGTAIRATAGARGRRSALPASRTPPFAWRIRGGRTGLPRGKPVGPASRARACAPSPGAGPTEGRMRLRSGAPWTRLRTGSRGPDCWKHRWRSRWP